LVVKVSAVIKVTDMPVVKKTVAYIVIDEDDCGKPVIEKWQLKKNIQYVVPIKRLYPWRKL
jgi:hypothetical protein